MSGILTFTGRKNSGNVIELPLMDIFISDHKKCMTCNPCEIQKLSVSAKRNGLNSPLMVRKTDRGYELLSELNDYYAAKLAGLESVPCILMDESDRNHGMISQIKMINDQNINFFKEAEEIEKLISYYGMTQEDAAAHLGKAQSTVANKLRLLRLTDEERKLIIDNHLTERHARALLRISSPKERIYILNMIIQHGFNVEKTEIAVDKIIGHRNHRETYRKRSRSIQSARTYINTIMKAVEGLEASGLNVYTQKLEHDNCLELRLRIPNKNNSHNIISEDIYHL